MGNLIKMSLEFSLLDQRVAKGGNKTKVGLKTFFVVISQKTKNSNYEQTI